jgi:hypothetical protein
MSWQQRPGGNFGGNRPPNQLGGQPPQPEPQPPVSQHAQEAVATEQAEPKELSLYQLLHVDRDAHTTIIRYAYRFLAAMYHPDNGETGDAEKFRVITEAWKTLSDDGRRAAYDMSLGQKEQSQGAAPHKPQPKINEFGRDSLPNIPKSGISWNEIELRCAILQIMLAARKKKPRDGGVSIKMIIDILNVEVVESEFALWYLREKKYIETGERVFMITGLGLDYLVDQLSKTQILDGGSSTERKTSGIVNSNLPAVINN